FSRAPAPRFLHSFPTRRSSDLFWKLAASSDFRSRGSPEAGGLAESIRAVRALPGKSGSAAAEVAISSGGLVNRTSQVQRLNDALDRKSTRLNSSHVKISYAVFC